MAPPSALTIATQSVQRLVKEKTYYHKELDSQDARIKKLGDDIQAGGPDLDQNAEFVLKQEKLARDETRAVFGPLKTRIADAVQKLEEQMAISESEGNVSQEELKKAREMLEAGQKAAQSEQ